MLHSKFHLCYTFHTNKNKTKIKGQFIGDELNEGLVTYNQWCMQHLMVRHTSIALLFFIFGVIGIYLINFPLYLLGLNGNKMTYLSLSGLWNVVCMIAIWTIHIYLYAVNYKISYQQQTKLNNNNNSNFKIFSNQLFSIEKAWKSFIPLIGYPFAALCFTSFYLSWLGIPFISSMNQIRSNPSLSSANNVNHNNNDNTRITIIQYSIFLLSYIYGYLPHDFYGKYNNISFKSIQASRSLFFKQTSIRIIISNFIQTFTFCVLCVIFWRIIQFLNIISFAKPNFLLLTNLDLNESFIIFWILFRITYCLNYLWLIGELILNRLMTEKCDLGRYNGCKFPLISSNKNDNTLSRNIDCRLLAITQSHPLILNDISKNTQIIYFYNLALIELLDIVQFDSKQRKQIYSTQIYYNLIVETLLSEYTTFIISLYEYIYGLRNINDQYRQNMINSNIASYKLFWYKTFTLKPEISYIFKNYQILIYSADILSFLIIHSLEEDELGIVQESLEQILCVLLECLDILDNFIKSKIYRKLYLKQGSLQKNEIINTLYKGIESSLMRIIMSMHSYLDQLKLPKKNAHRLQSYLVE